MCLPPAWSDEAMFNGGHKNGLPVVEKSMHPKGDGALKRKPRSICIIYIYISGQISSRPHTTDFPQKRLGREIPLFQGNLGW